MKSAGFDVVINGTAVTTDDLVTVAVKKGTGANKYVIDVTPKATSLGKGSQKVEIYPKDMFGSPSNEAWTFDAMFNTPPGLLDDSFGTIRLTRPVAGTGNTVETIAVVPATNGNVANISIADYFKDLQRVSGAIGDTVCAVTASPGTLAVVQELNAVPAAD